MTTLCQRWPLLVYDTLESWVSPVTLELHAWHLNTTETLKTFDQIRHKRVIVISGYNYGGLMSWMEKQSDIALTEAPDHRAAIDMLKRNRGDYLLDYRQPVQELLLAPGDENIHSTKLSSREGVWVFALNQQLIAGMLIYVGEFQRLPAVGYACHLRETGQVGRCLF